MHRPELMELFIYTLAIHTFLHITFNTRGRVGCRLGCRELPGASTTKLRVYVNFQIGDLVLDNSHADVTNRSKMLP